MYLTKPNTVLLIVAFFLVGLLADALPHPSLGPGLLSSTLNQTLR